MRSKSSELKILIYSFVVTDRAQETLHNIFETANAILKDELWLYQFSEAINPEVKLSGVEVENRTSIYHFDVYADAVDPKIEAENIDMKTSFRELRKAAFLGKLERMNVMEICVRHIGNL